MRIGIDIGGTFTDFVLFDERDGSFQTFKCLSTPHAPEVAVLDGLRSGNVPRDYSITHGSTVATNALLEGKGALTALIATEGFRDVIEIGRQNRAQIYDLFCRRPPPLVPAQLRFEAPERVDYRGNVLVSLDPDWIDRLIEPLRAAGVTSVAVSLLFSFVCPRHEAMIARRLREAGFFVSLSSEILPEYREYERTSTTVINAYVSPVMDRYLAQLEKQSGAREFRVIQSNGGSIRTDRARREAVRCILSGPAAGVVGARYVASMSGYDQLLTFDMGGTSTDVSLCDGRIRVATESEIRGLPIRVPVIDIHTVGSGGGSIAYVDAGGALRVGPESAGADPGPVCCGRGGTRVTVTDANLVLGRLAGDQFLGGEMVLDTVAAEAAMNELASAAALPSRQGLTPAQTVALGVIEVVNAQMERALRVISVQRGHDPRDFTLVSFGGAGSLHAVALARSLNMPRVLIPPNAATLSAFGMLAADVVKDYVQTVMLDGDTPYEELQLRMKKLETEGLVDVQAEGVDDDQIVLQPTLDMRYVGQSYELMVPLARDFVAAFHQRHADAYGYDQPTMPVEIVNLRLQAIGRLPRPEIKPVSASDVKVECFDRRKVILSDGPATVPFFRGDELQAGQEVIGPAIIVYPDTTVFLEASDRLGLDAYRNVIVSVGPGRRR